MAESVKTEWWTDGIMLVRMNRPEKRNALDAAQWERLTETFRELSGWPEIQCLVLTGSGTAFASGGDIARFLEEVEAPDGPRKFRERIRNCLEVLHLFPRPTVAMINGPAIGGGMELALVCDARVAARSVTMGIPAAKFGLVMAYPDFRRLASAVGVDRARFLTMTGRLVDAEEAYRIGLVHEIASEDDLERVTHSLAKELARVDLAAAMWFRQAAGFVQHPDQPGLSALRDFEEACLRTESFRARVTRFLERSRSS